MDAADKHILANLKAGTPLPRERPGKAPHAKTGCEGTEGLIDHLRCIADEMEAGNWTDQEAAVLITRGVDGYLTFCEWGKTGQLIAEAAQIKRTTT